MDTLREQYPDNPLFHTLSDETRIVVSEPLGDLAGAWNEVPESCYGVIQEGEDELPSVLASTAPWLMTSDRGAGFVEPRWPVALALATFIAISITLRVVEPDRPSIGPRWLVPAIEIALLVQLSSSPTRPGSPGVAGGSAGPRSSSCSGWSSPRCGLRLS